MKFILAIDEKNGIGKDNKLAWKHLEDMEFFKKVTNNKTVVMGHNTYKSIGKPLKNRVNIVLTNDYDLIINQLNKNIKSSSDINIDKLVYTSLKGLKKLIKMGFLDDAYCIGGKKIYELLFDYFTDGYITTIKGNYDCDTFINIENFSECFDFYDIINKDDYKISYCI